MIKNFKFKIKNCSQGFSLVELLVVIAIIAVISAFTLPNFMGARDRATDSARISDMDSIKNSLRLYYNDNQSYPIQVGGTLGLGMTGYMPGILNLGYTYDYISSNGDSFLLKLPLNSGQGDDDTNSQIRCGLGTTQNGLFVVCAN